MKVLLLVSALAVASSAALAPVPAAAQEALDRVEVLMEEARYAEARQSLEGWWNEVGPRAPRPELQRGLWLRGLLTVDPVMAEMDYRRLVVEFPGGPYSDEALLRLARGAVFMDDVAGARQYLDILIQDYPDSPHRVEGRALRDRLADRGDVDAAAPAAPMPVPAADPQPEPQPEPEPRSEPTPDPEPTLDPEPEPELVPTEEDIGSYTVQLGAFSTRERAEAFAAGLRGEGLDPRVVQVTGSELFRVRLGAFTSAEDAETEVERLEARGIDALVAGDRDAERPGTP